MDSATTDGTSANHETISSSDKVDVRAHNLAPAVEYADEKKHFQDPETLDIIDHVAEKKLVRKLDLFIVPPVMLLYLFVRYISFHPGID